MSVNEYKRRVLDDSSSESSCSSADDSSDVDTKPVVHTSLTAPSLTSNVSGGSVNNNSTGSIRIGNSKTKSKNKQDTVVASRIPNSTQPPAIWQPRDFQTWSEERKRAWRNQPKNPSAYYYRFSPPHVARIDTPWTDAERTKFQELHEGRFNKDWGYFSMNLPGRTGQMCEQFYKQQLEEKRTGVRAGKVLPHLPQEYSSEVGGNNVQVSMPSHSKHIPTSVPAVAVVKPEVTTKPGATKPVVAKTEGQPKNMSVPPSMLASGSSKVTVNRVETKQPTPAAVKVVKAEKRAVYDTPASRTSQSQPGAPFVNRSRSRAEDAQPQNLGAQFAQVSLTVKAVPLAAEEQLRVQSLPVLERSASEPQLPELPLPKTPIRPCMKVPKTRLPQLPLLSQLPQLPEPTVQEENDTTTATATTATSKATHMYTATTKATSIEQNHLKLLRQHSVFTAKPSSRGSIAYIPATGYNPQRLQLAQCPQKPTQNMPVLSPPCQDLTILVELADPEINTPVSTVYSRSSSQAQVALLHSHHNMQTHRFNAQIMEQKHRESLIDELVEQNEQVNHVWKKRKLEQGKEATRTTRSQNDGGNTNAQQKEEDNPIYQFDIDDSLNHRKPTTLVDFAYKLYSQFDPHKYSVDPVHSNTTQANYIYSTRTSHVRTVHPPRHAPASGARFSSKPKLDMWKNLANTGIPTTRCPEIKSPVFNTDTTQKFSEYVHLQTDGIVFGTAFDVATSFNERKLAK